MSTIRLRESIDDLLELQPETFHYRRFKRIIYAIDAVVLVVLIIALCQLYGFRLKPLFIPFGVVLAVICLFALILFIKSTIFKVMELKYADSASTKLIILRRISKRAVIAGVSGALVLSLLIPPQIVGAVENTMDITWKSTIPADTGLLNVTFEGKNNLDTVWADTLVIYTTEGREVRYTVTMKRQDGSERYVAAGILGINNPQDECVLFAEKGVYEYRITFISTESSSASVGHFVHYRVNGIFVSYIPSLAMSAVFAATIAWSFTVVQRKRYIRESIYESM